MSAAIDRRWAQTYPWLGEEPISTEPCTSAEIYEQEVARVFRKVWLCLGRVEEVPEPGSYKLKRL